MKNIEFIIMIFFFVVSGQALSGDELEELNLLEGECRNFKWIDFSILVCNRKKTKLQYANSMKKNQFSDNKGINVIYGMQYMAESYGSEIVGNLFHAYIPIEKRQEEKYLALLLVDRKGCKVEYVIGKEYLKAACSTDTYDLTGKIISNDSKIPAWNLFNLEIIKKGKKRYLNTQERGVNFFPEFYFKKFKLKEKVLTSLNWGRVDLLNSIINSNNVNDILDDNGNTALLLALNGNGEKTVDLVEFLISVGANVNLINKSKSSPLLLAMLSKNQKLVGFLIGSGANTCLFEQGSDDLNLILKYSDEGSREIFMNEYKKCRQQSEKKH